ncbi:hypothetical protein ACGFMK_13955 [Amycolatopsis sp. NPDC049252]|uniref:hypothetical protein n=1 Tax=Amycolatopsis sp. NPDC049252 TaxID=3363933 RepID=UPI00371C088B
MRTTRPGPGRPAFPALRDLATRYRRSSRTSSPAVRASVLRLLAAAPSPSEAR